MLPSQNWLSKIIPYAVFLLASMFYVYEFCLRVMPSTMTNQLMAHYNLSAQGLGMLASLFYFGYTPMQIPAGLLYDRFKPRILLAIGILLCASANFLFGHADNVMLASFARLLIGFTSSFAFIGALLVASRWFPPKQFAMLAGLVQTLGCLGAILGEAPIAALVSHYGWLTSINLLSLIGLILGGLVYYFISTQAKQSRYAHNNKPKELSITQSLKHILMQKQTWAVAGYAFCCWAPITIFATLWGPSCLHLEYQCTMTKASAMISIIWISIGICSPLTGWFSNHFGNRRTPLIVCASAGLVAFSLILLVPEPPFWVMAIFLFTFGFSATAQVITFGLVLDNQKDAVMGAAIGFNNMAVIFGGVLLQPLIGTILKHLWQYHPIMTANIPYYSFHEYQIALIIVPICFIAALLIAIYGIRETYAQRVHNHDTINTTQPSVMLSH